MSRLKPVKVARELRRRQTPAERILWNQLRSARTSGSTFRRQHPIGPYIVDFVCLEKKLVLEIDGGQHNEPGISRRDRERTIWLESEGYKVLRFWNNDVIANADGVVTVILQAVGLTPSSRSSPSEGRRRTRRPGSG